MNRVTVGWLLDTMRNNDRDAPLTCTTVGFRTVSTGDVRRPWRTDVVLWVPRRHDVPCGE
jgi:hypothetical protein